MRTWYRLTLELKGIREAQNILGHFALGLAECRGGSVALSSAETFGEQGL